MKELLKIAQPAPALGYSIPAAFGWLKQQPIILKKAKQLDMANPALIEFAYFMSIYIEVICASLYSLLPDEIEQCIADRLALSQPENGYLCAVLTRADGSGAILLCSDGADSPNRVLIDTGNDTAIQCETIEELTGIFGDIYSIGFEYCAVRNEPKQYDFFTVRHVIGEPNQPMAATDLT